MFSVVLFALSAFLIYKYRDVVIEFLEKPDPQTIVQEFEIEYDQTYITETSYDGTKELHPALFSIPFKRSEYYNCNKDLVKVVPRETLEQISVRGNKIAKELFNISSADVSSGYKEKESKLKDVFQLTGTYVNDADEWFDVNGFIADYLKTAADSGLETKADFETDSCLVYQDTIYYIRGLLVLEVINVSNTESFRSYLDIPLEAGHVYEIIYEIGVAPYSGIKNNKGDYEDSRKPEDMRMASFELLKVITDKEVD